ncbi:MAG: SRPBCC family protein [Pseudolabrys sp.]|nr:SRPBCC family protein [Pseudolabrys sp.]
MTKASFVYVTYIRSTPQKVWDALTDGEITRQYWGHRNLSDWKSGSAWEHKRLSDGGADIVGKVLETAPPKRLVISWADPASATQPEKVSRVEFNIEPYKDDSVKLTVSHTELEPGSGMERGISKGWPAVLSALKSFLETGKATPL